MAWASLCRHRDGKKLCRDATVIVAGAGNSAGQPPCSSETAKKVLLVVRGNDLTKSMSSYLRRVETKENTEYFAH
jgi:thioredoxin reductase (NADPH)